MRRALHQLCRIPPSSLQQRVCGVATIAASPRGKFSVIEDNDLSAFEKILGKNNVLTEDLDPYNTDFLHIYKGSSKCVLFPTSSEEVSAILRHCYSRNLAVVPQSGNTGLVGGSVPVYDEVVLSLKKLNKNFQFDPHTGSVECDAGLILEEASNRLAPEGYTMPWDTGSKGSCLLGGNVATGVGGARMLRYGSLHNHITGLKVVLADEKGSVVNFGSKMRKDNTNLHIHHLFIGSEGQLGVVTGISMCAVPKPSCVQVAMLGVGTYSGCRDVLQLARLYLGEILSAFEFIDGASMRCLDENKKLRSVLTSNPPFNVLVETMGSNEAHDKEKMDSFLKEALNRGLAVDGVQAANAQEAAYMWKLRNILPIAAMPDGFLCEHDIALPLEYFYEIAEILRERLGSMATRVISFGHMAEGDNHINISAKKYSNEFMAKIYPFLCEWTVEHGGSISAEHGIGQERRTYAKIGKGYEVDLARQLKKQFDPKCILSPYKMIEAL
uniref:D-2-hydroxyglutarate dehydrogenase, mitochondrial n=1 Tax=Ascaris suum TaxID=6253 RepID=F1L4I4_ASCSU